MLRIEEIVEVVPYSVTCKFNTGEVKKIVLNTYISAGNHLVDKIKLLNPDFFKEVQIGRFGELFWNNAAFMQNEKDELIPCEFDLSPEFVYHNSTAVYKEWA